MQSILTFEVEDFQPVLSDHCQIIATLQSFIIENSDIEVFEIPSIKWSQLHEEHFKNNLNRTEFEEIDTLIRDIPSIDMPNYNKEDIKNKINHSVNRFTQMLQKASGGIRGSRSVKKSKKKKSKPGSIWNVKVKSS